MEKNMRMKFLKQRITVILLLVASVCICGSINEFYVFENDYYFSSLPCSRHSTDGLLYPKIES